jgi:hypothetical protein
MRILFGIHLHGIEFLLDYKESNKINEPTIL